MRVIIAGSRTVTDMAELEKAITASGFQITSIVCGGAIGADKLGEKYAYVNDIPITYFLPDWDTHGKKAGPIRNSEMANYVGSEGAAIILWDGISKGSQDMINKASAKGLKVYVHLVVPKV